MSNTSSVDSSKSDSEGEELVPTVAEHVCHRNDYRISDFAIFPPIACASVVVSTVVFDNEDLSVSSDGPAARCAIKGRRYG